MSQNLRTIIFAAVAAVSVGAAAFVSVKTAPKPLDEFAKVGETFYDDFDINAAGLLELTAIPDGETKPRTFRVEFADGLWRIQSHHGYPAEAKQRLAETAASIIGVERIALAGGKSKQERFGVLDPEQKDLADPKAAGARIRILDKSKQTLVDLIIGKRAGEEVLKTQAKKKDTGDATKPLHYVRRPDEQETYLARIELNVSTKFSDWIEPDLLKLEADNLRKLEIHNYDVRQAIVPVGDGQAMMRSVKVDPTTLVVSRDQQWDPWTLKGLDEKTESMRTEKVTDVVSILDDMKILGVSPRFKSEGKPPLTGDLQLRPPASAAGDLRALSSLIRNVSRDLQDKGFSLEFDPKDFTRERVQELLKTKGAIPSQLLSQHGEFAAATKEGIVYHLHFGSIVEGSGKELELGGKAKPEKKDAKQPNRKDKKSAAKKPDDFKDETHRRYVLIRVEFDKSAMDNPPKEPTKPVEPKKPPGYKEPPKVAAKKQEPQQQPVMALRPGQFPPPAAAVRPNHDAHYRYSVQQFKDDQRHYETDRTQFRDDQKAFDKRIEKSKAIVERLNERFAGWYYVVSTQSLQQLKLTRDKLVGPKEKEKSAAPKFGGFNFPGKR
jgi:hypothetical protein